MLAGIRVYTQEAKQDMMMELMVSTNSILPLLGGENWGGVR
jgi:hypothetical protein